MSHIIQQVLVMTSHLYIHLLKFGIFSLQSFELYEFIKLGISTNTAAYKYNMFLILSQGVEERVTEHLSWKAPFCSTTAVSV